MMVPGDGHFHRETWTREEQHRYEDKVSDELKALRADIRDLSTRLLLMLGGLGLLAFLLPLIAPFIRSAIGSLGGP